MKSTFAILAIFLFTSFHLTDAQTPAATPANIATFTQSMKKYEGFFNFYYDEKAGKLFLEVDKLDKEFLYFSSLTDGVGNGGPERGQASSALA